MFMAFRSGLFLAGEVLLTACYGVILIFVLPMPKLVRHRVIISWCWLVIQWLRLTCGISFEVLGREHLKAGGARVFLSKHQSAWETFMLQVILFPAATILKRELLSIPIFGWGLSWLQPIAIDRSNPREALKMVKQGGIARLQDDINVLLFPEGTRTRPGERGKYARSGAEIAIAAGVDVVPVAVNAGRCWPAKGWRKSPGRVTVAFGEPISCAAKTSRQITEEAERWIETRMAELP